LVLSANQKGAIAETKIVAEAVERGPTVLTPVVEHSRYDMAFDIAGRLYRASSLLSPAAAPSRSPARDLAAARAAEERAARVY
jgi:hypothetical protein